MKKLALVLALVSVPALAQDRIAKFDVNGDKVVDYAELSTQCDVRKSLFEVADKNGDGVLSNKELADARRYLLDNCRKQKDA